MPLTDDEYTCLLIMKDGENLIRMRDTRWYAPLGSLHEKAFIKPIGGNNFVISQAGVQALAAHDQIQDQALTGTINAYIAANNARVIMQQKMREAVDLLASAADIASRTTGESKKDALRKIAHEVLEHALGRIA